MRFLGNIIWFIFGGLFLFLMWSIAGLLLCITIIGIPFGTQCFKFAWLNLAPFGKNIVTHFSEHPIINIIWLLLFGWEMAIGYLVSGIICCVTIVGIPFGLQSFKMMQLSLFPFGAHVV
ncbi:MAG: YccF domain-containing protein [Eubacteriales bacterium]